MIERYTPEKIGKIWAEQAKFSGWLDVEIAACEALSETGVVPRDAVERIKKNAKVDVERIKELELGPGGTGHDLIAFLKCLAESLGDDARYVHLGLTSYDVEDTALAIRMRDSAAIILADLEALKDALIKQARKHKHTVMVGRTHGVHAEPTTLGLKFALWVKELERDIERVEKAKETISVGKLSGAVGNFAHTDPGIEEYVCKRLDLKPAPVSTQILQRDRHAEYLTSLAITAGSLDKFATEIRNLQRTEIGEVAEPFKKGQKGSSAMPHKRNPIVCERISGLARVIRANAAASLDNIALWHERDLTNSSAERILIPDTIITTDYIIIKCREVIKDLDVFPERMKENLARTGGLIFSQRILLALVEKGLSRDKAYNLVQAAAKEAWDGKTDFTEALLKSKEITSLFNSREIEEFFDTAYYLRNVDTIFKRAGIS